MFINEIKDQTAKAAAVAASNAAAERAAALVVVVKEAPPPPSPTPTKGKEETAKAAGKYADEDEHRSLWRRATNRAAHFHVINESCVCYEAMRENENSRARDSETGD